MRKIALACVVAFVATALLATLSAGPASAGSNTTHFRVASDCKSRKADWAHPGGNPVVQGGDFNRMALLIALRSPAGRRAMHCAGLTTAEQNALIKGALRAVGSTMPNNTPYVGGVMCGKDECFVNGALT